MIIRIPKIFKPRIMSGLILVIIMSGCQKKPVQIYEISSVVETAAMEFQFHPHFDSSDPILNHYGYTAQFSLTHNQPRWVAFHLDQGRLSGPFGPFQRRLEYSPDPLLGEQSPKPEWYTKRGYTPTPLVPREFMQWSEKAHLETFYASNLSMQSRQLNSGLWRLLLLHYDQWTKLFNDIYIINGPVLSEDLNRLTLGQVVIPEKFFSVIFRALPDPACIAFLLPQEVVSTNLQRHIVPVDSIEAITGIDFLTALSDSAEKVLEQSLNTHLWPLGTKRVRNAF